MDKVCIYSRKSRLEEEIERKTGQDTLATHRKDLLKFAKNNNLNIVKMHEELESGDSIIHRPRMIELLKEIDAGMYNAVLCMDIDRLGRGDMQDQGLIINTFKRTKTLIITLDKTYDLENELDEQFTELKTFMSRQEYKMITKRLKAGVRHFVEYGNYIPPLPPYGYSIKRTDRDRTLEIIPEQAEVIKLIFDMCLQGTGINQISRELNELGYKSYYGNKIERSWVAKVLRNPIYAGFIIWSRKEIKKSTDPFKKRESKMRPADKHLISEGKHEAIISKDVFDIAQKKLLSEHRAPVKKQHDIMNPLAGLVKCKLCGSAMCRVYNRQINGKYLESLVCKKYCGNRGVTLHYVEEELIEDLKKWLGEYKSEWHEYSKHQTNNQIDIWSKKLAAAKRELSSLIKQKNSLHDLVEKGVYNTDTFLERSKIVSETVEKTLLNSKQLEKDIKEYKQKASLVVGMFPGIEELIKNYWELTISERNKVLRKYIDKVDYYKSTSWRGNHFELTLHIKT